MSKYKVGDKLAFIDGDTITIRPIENECLGVVTCNGFYLQSDLSFRFPESSPSGLEVYPLSDEALDQIATIIKGSKQDG